LTIHEQTWHNIDKNVLVFGIIGAVSAIHVALNSLLYIPKSFMYTRPNIKVYIYIYIYMEFSGNNEKGRMHAESMTTTE
jgi:hypothetical protein